MAALSRANPDRQNTIDRTAPGKVEQESALVIAEPNLFSDNSPGFIHERMLKGAAISIDRYLATEKFKIFFFLAPGLLSAIPQCHVEAGFINSGMGRTPHSICKIFRLIVS